VLGEVHKTRRKMERIGRERETESWLSLKQDKMRKIFSQMENTGRRN